jgi:hypothetical protein
MSTPFTPKERVWDDPLTTGNLEWKYAFVGAIILSRGQAKRTLKLEDFQNQMKAVGVFSTSICAETLDEAPGSYKDAATIQNAIEPTAKIIHVLEASLQFEECRRYWTQEGKGCIMTEIYCKFIDGNVDKSKLPKLCKSHIGETECTHCDRSPQLDHGVTTSDLIQNFKGW